MAQLQRVIFALLSPANSFERRVLSGIASVVLPRPEWTVCVVDPDAPRHIDFPKKLVAGAIGRVSEAFAEQFRRRRVPVVVTSSSSTDAAWAPRVIVDNERIGELAATHLLDCGIRHFAYVGWDNGYGRGRLHGFARAVDAAGGEVSRYGGIDAEEVRRNLQFVDRGLGDWLKSLPKPVGVFCTRDQVAFHVSATCRLFGLAVPEQVAIAGVDNDDLFCGLCFPPMTSVQTAGERLGARAAELLDAMIGGKRPTTMRATVPPLGVVARQSTSVLHLDDADVAAAAGFIRANAHRPLRIEDVVAATTAGRRTLERQFRRALGRSLLDEVRRCRVERAKRLLTETTLPLKSVARRCGFRSTEQFHHVFAALAGETPHAFRVARRNA